MSDYEDDAIGGVLGGEGAQTYDRVKAKTTPNGVVFEVPCAGCGREQGVMAPWPEVAIMAVGQQPGNTWLYNQHAGGFMPNLACRCRINVRLVVTPDECSRYLRSGMAAGAVGGQDIARWQAPFRRQG